MWHVRWYYMCGEFRKLKSNTASVHICEIRVLRPYSVILYEFRLDHSIHWCKIKTSNLSFKVVCDQLDWGSAKKILFGGNGSGC